MTYPEVLSLNAKDVQDIKNTEIPYSGRTVSGFGKKLPSATELKVSGRWYRVYLDQYSNVGTAYIVSKGRKLYVSDSLLIDVEEAKRKRQDVA